MPSDPIADKPLYPSDNLYGIPNLRYTPLTAVPNWLIPYRTRVRPQHSVEGGAVHFFLFDAIFESVWTCPTKSGRYLQRFTTVLSPDFSLSAEMPLALQIYNVYRNRWCAADWQAKGVTWQMFQLMKPGLAGGLSSRTISGETGPMHLVKDTLTQDASLVPLYRAMARYADASAQGISLKVEDPADLKPWG